MAATAAVEVESLSHAYGDRRALDDVSFDVRPGEIFAFLGPNGGGKTTLFRILSTLISSQTGTVRIFGESLSENVTSARCQMGVVFQAPSLDKKLTVDENMAQQAALYGLTGRLFQQRRNEVLQQLGLADRRSERAETLSGGLRRRVDLAKALIHQPRLLLMDEPTTGLDPGVRSDLWQYLRQLQTELQVTVVLTTHLLDEADRADRLAILHEGRLVAEGRPSDLRAAIGGDSITIESNSEPSRLRDEIKHRFSWDATIVDQSVRLSCPNGAAAVKQIMGELSDQIQSIKLGKPTLEDVFIAKTGHRFWSDAADSHEAVMTIRGTRR